MTIKLGSNRSSLEDVELIRGMYKKYAEINKTAAKYKLEAIAGRLGVEPSKVTAAVYQGFYTKESWFNEAVRLNTIRKNLRERAKETSPRVIAAKFGLSVSHVYSIINDKSWKKSDASRVKAIK